MRSTGNTIFLPGGTSGLGRGLAERFAARGDRVIIGGRRQELLDQIAASSDRIEAVRIDTSDAASIRDVSAEVQERFPETDALLAMAGIMRPEDVTTGGFLADAEATVTTNLLGPIRLWAAWADFLTAKEEATLITVSSGLAFTPLALTPTYDATKSGVHALSDAWRLQLAGTGVQVIELVPPAVRTDLMPGPNDANAMPLEEYLDETVRLLEEQPEAREILVQRVQRLRFSERDGDRDELMAVLAGSH
ncbi:SDR family oxidoreductase [Amnibacterium kyonggiense]|uniref:Short-subunit dehydrogenase involved in D-alanine esterification of teichoic acids n=1 Tax=Amnibacterium kyonggiense TaxID=595671 RepID=A0A4R7FL76_9MICO|nr:SDR family NAD(P)-dependent oxidoreductase [Amnibacterium kyonggiense]TDS77117.1 short-subunit dehydrogenase involved in D-alanine esterification of teichoic acids [Amnibacterium kyonggiense]